MSEVFTTIELPGQRAICGMQDHGRKPASEMLKQVREYAAHLREVADTIDRAEDTDFRIYQHRGTRVKRNIVVLQEGRNDQL